MEQEKILKKQIIESAESVKRKVKMMRDLKADSDIALNAVFKQITDPLQKLASESHKYSSTDMNVSPITTLKKRKLSFTPTSNVIVKKIKPDNNESLSAYEYSEIDSEDNEKEISRNKENEEGLIPEITIESESNGESENDSMEFHTPDRTFDSTWSVSKDIVNVPFGVRRDRGKLFLGNSRLTLSEKQIKIGAQCYDKTPGLMELLFKKSPDLDSITSEDKLIYKSMLLTTNAHRRDFDSKKPIKSNKGIKYNHIIKPMFLRLGKNNYPSTDSVNEGAGLAIIKQLAKDVDFVYWDDPNELVERLKLLLASKSAGNTGVNNEIVSIIEELRESGLLN